MWKDCPHCFKAFALQSSLNEHLEVCRSPEERVVLLTRVADAAREFESGLSHYCDGPERERLRAALAALS